MRHPLGFQRLGRGKGDFGSAGLVAGLAPGSKGLAYRIEGIERVSRDSSREVVGLEANGLLMALLLLARKANAFCCPYGQFDRNVGQGTDGGF